jgi:DNA-directed RNA polymerase sigma subunit (sigma70/sigma32)
MTQVEVSEIFRLNRERVRQLEKKAIERLVAELDGSSQGGYRD